MKSVFQNTVNGLLDRVLEPVQSVIYVSITPNKSSKDEESSFSDYKLVLTIRTDSHRGKAIEHVAKSLSSVILEDHSDDNARHFIIYGKDATTIKYIMRTCFEGAKLMSNVRYEPTTLDALMKKADKRAVQAGKAA